jgi:hypothetical protein
VAPQLVTMTEKSPFLSSYTPTIFLPSALAPPRAAATATQHSARSSGVRSIIVGQREECGSACCSFCQGPSATSLAAVPIQRRRFLVDGRGVAWPPRPGRRIFSRHDDDRTSTSDPLSTAAGMTNEQLRAVVCYSYAADHSARLLPWLPKMLGFGFGVAVHINRSIRCGVQVMRSYPFAGTKHDGDRKEDCGRERGSRRKVTVRSSGFSPISGSCARRFGKLPRSWIHRGHVHAPVRSASIILGFVFFYS